MVFCILGRKIARKVGRDCGDAQIKIHAGSRVMIEFEKTRSVKKDRKIVAELVLSMEIGQTIIIKTRPIGTSREAPLDALGKDLVASKDIQDLRDNYWDVAVEDMRDRFLLVLWDALFLTACENGHKTASPTPLRLRLSNWVTISTKAKDSARNHSLTGFCSFTD